ncbi:unnamed protein product, partial [Polarella glacialis]
MELPEFRLPESPGEPRGASPCRFLGVGGSSPEGLSLDSLEIDQSDAEAQLLVPAEGVGGGGFCSKQIALIVTCVLVDALAPLAQEQASRSSPGAVLVLAETLTYFLGGLALA